MSHYERRLWSLRCSRITTGIGQSVHSKGDGDSNLKNRHDVTPWKRSPYASSWVVGFLTVSRRSRGGSLSTPSSRAAQRSAPHQSSRVKDQVMANAAHSAHWLGPC